jgi:hypothetical protein
MSEATPSIDELRRENARLEALLDAGLRDRLLAYPGVYHVAVGVKERNGKATGEVGFRVYVEEKLPEQQLPPDARIPAEIGGVKTDVNLPPRREPAMSDETMHRPILGGIKVGNGFSFLKAGQPTLEAGTLGCIGTNRRDKSISFLTNWHVVFAAGGGIGSKIYQPNPTFTDLSATTVTDENVIGVVVDGIVDASVDCAVVKVDTSWCRTCGVDWDDSIKGLALNGYDGISGLADAVPNEHVFLVGYRTGHRVEGTVATVTEAPVSVTYEHASDSRVAPVGPYTQIFTNQITVNPLTTPGAEPFGLQGDSGSVVVNAKSEIVGLFFSLDPATGKGTANHIDKVLQELHSQRNIDFDPNFRPIPPPATPHRGASIAVPRALPPADDSVVWRRAREQLRASPTGDRVAQAVELHRREAVDLVNRSRPVTVAWRRQQGPALVAHVLKSIKEPGYSIPESVDGVTLDALTERMVTTLSQHGSEPLRTALEADGDRVVAAARGCTSFEQFASRLGEEDL